MRDKRVESRARLARFPYDSTSLFSLTALTANLPFGVLKDRIFVAGTEGNAKNTVFVNGVSENVSQGAASLVTDQEHCRVLLRSRGFNVPSYRALRFSDPVERFEDAIYKLEYPISIRPAWGARVEGPFISAQKLLNRLIEMKKEAEVFAKRPARPRARFLLEHNGPGEEVAIALTDGVTVGITLNGTVTDPQFVHPDVVSLAQAALTSIPGLRSGEVTVKLENRTLPIHAQSTEILRISHKINYRRFHGRHPSSIESIIASVLGVSSPHNSDSISETQFLLRGVANTQKAADRLGDIGDEVNVDFDSIQFNDDFSLTVNTRGCASNIVRLIDSFIDSRVREISPYAIWCR